MLTLGRDWGENEPKLGPGDDLIARVHELEALIHGSPHKPPPPVPPLEPTLTIATEDLFKANMGQGWGFLAKGSQRPDSDKAPAIEVFDAITRTFPGRHEGWIGLGKAYDSAGRLEKAREAMGKAIEVLPSSADAWFNMGEIQRRQGMLLDAAQSYKQARRLRPYSIQDHLAQIKALIEADQLIAGEGELEELAKTHGSDPEVVYLRGMLAARRGQWQTALDHFDRVLAGEPENAEAHRQRGKVLFKLGRTTDAVEALGRVCELDSLNFEAHSLIGGILTGDPSTRGQAYEYLQRAYQMGIPGNRRLAVQALLADWTAGDPNLLWQYMVLDQGRGDHEACLRWIEMLVQVPKPWEHDPNRMERMANVQLFAGRSLLALGESDRAIEVWQEGVGVHEPVFFLHFELGTLLQDLGRHTGALPYLERAQELISQVDTKEGKRLAFAKKLTTQIKNAKQQGTEFMGPR